MKKVFTALALLMGFALAGSAAQAATTTEVVTPASLAPGGHWFSADTRPPGTGTFEAGPAAPPLGAGSFEARTPDTTAKVQLLTNRHDGVRLDAITGLGYATYRDALSTGFEGAVPAINLLVDLDDDGTFDTTMVYEPYFQSVPAVATGVWQSWDAYAGRWWFSRSATLGRCAPGYSSLCSWSEIVGAYPNARILTGGPGSFGLNQGSFNAGTVANADALSITVVGNKTVYDLEATPPAPTSADQCKKDGWKNYGTMFKNQGDCVSSVKPGH